MNHHPCYCLAPLVDISRYFFWDHIQSLCYSRTVLYSGTCLAFWCSGFPLVSCTEALWDPLWDVLIQCWHDLSLLEWCWVSHCSARAYRPKIIVTDADFKEFRCLGWNTQMHKLLKQTARNMPRRWSVGRIMKKCSISFPFSTILPFWGRNWHYMHNSSTPHET